MKIVVLVALVSAYAATPSLALGESSENGECGYRASFNCAKADDAESRIICSTPDLRAADCAMGYAYRDARALPGANPNEWLRKNQRRWVASRDAACAGRSGPAQAACLKKETEQRLRWLIGHYSLPVTGKAYESYWSAKASDLK
ncbi:MAG: lysozyme inhibitor LprI family protein [Rhodospirillaceae bacterium]